MVTKSAIIRAATEARIFLARIKALTADDLDHVEYYGNSRTGALRRQSMELTRALANMRKTGYEVKP